MERRLHGYGPVIERAVRCAGSLGVGDVREVCHALI